MQVTQYCVMMYSSANSEIANGVQKVAKSALHNMIAQRLVSVQEASHEVMDYPLTFTSDVIHRVSLSKCQKLQTNAQKEAEKETKSSDLIILYRNREQKHANMSLSQYFYDIFCKEKLKVDKSNRILMGTGLNFKAKYPPNFEYARGIILLYKPWGSTAGSLNRILRDKELAVHTFLKMIEHRQVPTVVITQYRMVQIQSQMDKIEILAKQTNSTEPDIKDMDDDDNELYVAHQNCSNFTDNHDAKIPDILDGEKVNIGLGYPWSENEDTVQRNYNVEPESYVSDLRDKYYTKIKEEVKSPEQLRLPQRKDGQVYTVNDLMDLQRVIVLAAVDTIVKFIKNDADYKPLRATIVGAAGAGKSFVINTLVYIIRNLTQCNDSVLVTAPSGCAAYNVGGCTLHRALMISIYEKTTNLSEENKKKLQIELKRLLCFVIDERSMLASHILANAETNIRLCAFGGNNTKEYWGGVPVVLLFGDDYQLRPVASEGAIAAYNKKVNGNITKRHALKKNDQLSVNHGNHLFIKNLTDTVFILTGNKRVNEGEEEFRNLLSRLRIGEPNEDDITRLCNLHIAYYPLNFEEELENKGRVMYLAATHRVKDAHNFKKLKEVSNRDNVPIARIRCNYESQYSNTDGGVRYSHFRGIKYISNTPICVGSRVCIETHNYIPELGLFTGAIGRVEYIDYDEPEGPNNNQMNILPNYIIVDFPNFKPALGLEPWDKNNPTVSICFYLLFVFQIDIVS